MGPFMLLHVIFAGKGFVAGGAQDVLFACMLLAMTGGVTRRGEGVTTRIAGRVWTRIFFLDRFGGWIGGGRCCRGGRSGGRNDRGCD